MRRFVVPAFIAASVAWVFVLSVAPLLPAPLAAVTYAFGSLVCHQRPERSFYLGAVQFPVCARCLAIYGGAAVAGLGLAASRAGAVAFVRSGSGTRLVLALAALPTAVTVAAEWVGAWQPSNIARAIAGAPLGAAVSLVVIGALSTLHYAECAPRRPIAPPPPRTRI